MNLYVLGSGTCIPTVERGPSGLALAVDSHLIFFDGGGGSLRQMVRLGLDYRRVDFLCLTHFHPDHVSDFVPFLFAMNYTVRFTRSLPLHIIGPQGVENFYTRLKEIYGEWIASKTYDLSLHQAAEERLDFSDLAIQTLPMQHSDASIGFRVEAGGKALVYSGDTDYCQNIVRLGKKADLLILECSFPDERKAAGHLTPTLAGRIAREAHSKKLLLTHFYPVFQGHDILKECQKEFSGEILLAEDGMKITI
jgi:ribonuclease BN (tRNA processing enzyme)